MPATARHALSGGWKRGPGRAVFDAATAELGPLPLIAEDLGVITPAVERLRDGLGYPGMAIVQYAFDPDPHSPHLLANHRENPVVYAGTRDHDAAAAGTTRCPPRAPGTGRWRRRGRPPTGR